MANMLIRTRQLKCKFRTAFFLRVILFFTIPTVYLICVNFNKSSDNTLRDAQFESSITGSKTRFSSRHLLGIERDELNCTPAAILEFPPDGLTRYQRQNGFIILHCLLATYCFIFLASICAQYFVPAIEVICERFNMAEDIAGGTFMAAASSSPELFINCVGTFITKGDLGVGAVVGSAVFNVLAVPACCGILSGKIIELDWWSVSRDCLMYAVAVVALIVTLLDDKVYWHEALLLVLMYTVYILAMVYNSRLGKMAQNGFWPLKKPNMYTEVTPLLIKEKNGPLDVAGRMENSNLHDVENGHTVMKRHDSTDTESSTFSLWSWIDDESSTFMKIYQVIILPINLLLWLTVPDCKRHVKLYPITFMMCIAWIGGVSYLVAWIITVLGDTLNIPDSITGLTILAAGTSLPEAVSSVLVTQQGHGTMGISNTIGSNTFDILLCLGLPWLIKSLFYPNLPGQNWVTINSSGLSYSTISLLSTLLALYSFLVLNKFQLDWKVGVTCALIYIIFLTLAVLIELNVFFIVNLPICPH